MQHYLICKSCKLEIRRSTLEIGYDAPKCPECGSTHWTEKYTGYTVF